MLSLRGLSVLAGAARGGLEPTLGLFYLAPELSVLLASFDFLAFSRAAACY